MKHYCYEFAIEEDIFSFHIYIISPGNVQAKTCHQYEKNKAIVPAPLFLYALRIASPHGIL